MIIEGLDIKTLRAVLEESGLEFSEEDKSLMLIEKCFKHHCGSANQPRLDGLRTVQLIRSKVKGHSSGSEAADLARDAFKRHETFAAHFEQVSRIVGDELDRIERLFS